MKHFGWERMEGRRRRSKDHVQYIRKDALGFTVLMRTQTHDSIQMVPVKLTDPFWCQGAESSAAVPHVNLA